jgi:hypothetical protein
VTYLNFSEKADGCRQVELDSMMSFREDISGLLGFISCEEIWRARLRDVAAEHLMPGLEEFNVDHDELAGVLG